MGRLNWFECFVVACYVGACGVAADEIVARWRGRECGYIRSCFVEKKARQDENALYSGPENLIRLSDDCLDDEDFSTARLGN